MNDLDNFKFLIPYSNLCKWAVIKPQSTMYRYMVTTSSDMSFLNSTSQQLATMCICTVLSYLIRCNEIQDSANGNQNITKNCTNKPRII